MDFNSAQPVRSPVVSQLQACSEVATTSEGVGKGGGGGRGSPLLEPLLVVLQQPGLDGAARLSQ